LNALAAECTGTVQFRLNIPHSHFPGTKKPLRNWFSTKPNQGRCMTPPFTFFPKTPSHFPNPYPPIPDFSLN
jgi:hypothetical protein